MQNERGGFIDELLAHQREAALPAPSWPRPRPGRPSIPDLMNVALAQAAPEVAERVRRHLPDCDYCRACVAAYQNLLRDEEVPGPPLAGSPLERGAHGPAEPKRPPVTSRSSLAESSAPGPTGFTAAVRAGHAADVEDRLRPWPPFLLRSGGLTDAS